MILEGLVSTLNADGSPHVAPMGPHVEGIDFNDFVLRPFPTSQTYQNLLIHPEGVLHVTDDALLIAKSAIGIGTGKFQVAEHIRGFVLSDCHRYYEFRITNIDSKEQRIRMTANVVCCGMGTRRWFGFNRARHGVLEAAILATRVHLLPREQLEQEFKVLQVIVDKTGGNEEKEAMELLRSHVNSSRAKARKR
jgi:hypothetical protein